MNPIFLSPSKLNLLNECPRCFWDAYAANCGRPRGIFPSLPGGMDLVIKSYLDLYRGDLPPVLKGRIPAVLFNDMIKLNRWRNWRTGLSYEDPGLAVQMIGALDDCLVSPEGLFIPFDAKTKGSVPKDNGAQYYQTQMDCYCLMLQHNGFPVADHAWLAYFSPKAVVRENDSSFNEHHFLNFTFDVTPFKVGTNVDAAKQLIEKACEILRGSRPPSHGRCEFCIYHAAHDELKNVVAV